MNKFQKSLFVFALGLFTWQAIAQTNEPCPEEIATKLLEAIVSRNEHALTGIARNAEVFDSEGIGYLIGDKNFRFPGRKDLRSAYAVLNSKKILTKLTVTELADQSQKKIDIIYLPISTAPDFIELAKMVGHHRALPFRDYVMCTLILRNGIVSMPHACYAETDALD